MQCKRHSADVSRPFLPTLWAAFGPPGVYRFFSWGPDILVPSQALLEAFCGFLGWPDGATGPCWDARGTSWDILGASWGPLGFLEAFGRVLKPPRQILRASQEPHRRALGIVWGAFCEDRRSDLQNWHWTHGTLFHLCFRTSALSGWTTNREALKIIEGHWSAQFGTVERAGERSPGNLSIAPAARRPDGMNS